MAFGSLIFYLRHVDPTAFAKPHYRKSALLLRILLCSGALLAQASSIWAQSGADDAFSLARNLYRDARDYATASDLFADFLRNYPDGQQAPQARLFLARSHKNNQRCDLAISAYEDFFRRHPEHLSAAEARQEQAACLAEEGRYLEAARAYEEVQRRFRASDFAPQALLEAAVNYTLSENVGQAIHLYRRLVEEYSAQPQAHQARYRLALLLFAQGNSDAAQRLLAQVAGAEPAPAEAPRALLLEGRIDLFLGREKGARAAFEQLHKSFGSAAASDSARMMLKMKRIGPQPSITAASTRSRGNERKCWRSRKIEKTCASQGTMRAE